MRKRFKISLKRACLEYVIEQKNVYRAGWNLEFVIKVCKEKSDNYILLSYLT